MEKNAEQNNLISQSTAVGIDETVSLSFVAIDTSKELSLPQKRTLIYSLLSFNCVFNADIIKDYTPLLKKYNLTKGAVMPVKEELYSMVLSIINLSTSDTYLKALWYITFSYLLLLNPPHNLTAFNKIKKTLITKIILKEVLNSKYSVLIKDTIEELESDTEIPPSVIEWLTHYITFKQSKNAKGATKEEERFLLWLQSGRFKEVFFGTEKYLDSYPDDSGVVVCNIAARISLDESIVPVLEREEFLKSTLTLIHTALESNNNKKVYLNYYAGLTNLALSNKDIAIEYFNRCLELKKDFEPAKKMLVGLNS